MSGVLVPLVSPSSTLISVVGAGVVYGIDNPTFRTALIEAGQVGVFFAAPNSVVRHEPKPIGNPSNDAVFDMPVARSADPPDKIVSVFDPLSVSFGQAVYLRRLDGRPIAFSPGQSFAFVQINGDGSYAPHSLDSGSGMLRPFLQAVAIVGIAMIAAPYIVGAVEGVVGAAGAMGTAPVADVAPFVGPVADVAPFVGPIADVAPFVGPIEVAATTSPGWTLAETVAAAKAVGTSTMEGVKVLNQVAGAVGAVAAVSAAIQGPSGGSAQAPAPAPEPDSVVEKFAVVFDDLKTQLSSVDKKTWYMVGGAVVLLSMG